MNVRVTELLMIVLRSGSRINTRFSEYTHAHSTQNLFQTVHSSTYSYIGQYEYILF